ncbi:hypothetical protein MMC28_008967 [Mycoblastus sanguinarius]|nr:hypothetical protein [Mycoblastus sanguinarius]
MATLPKETTIARDCDSAFVKVKESKIEFVCYKFSDDGKQIVIDYAAEPGESWKVLESKLPKDEPRYVVYNLDKDDTARYLPSLKIGL